MTQLHIICPALRVEATRDDEGTVTASLVMLDDQDRERVLVRVELEAGDTYECTVIDAESVAHLAPPKEVIQ